MPERKRGGVRGLWLGRMMRNKGVGVRFDGVEGGWVDGSAAAAAEGGSGSQAGSSQAGSVDGSSSQGGGGESRDGSRRGSIDSDATITSNTATPTPTPRAGTRTTGTAGGLTIGSASANGAIKSNGTAPARSLSRSPLAQLPFDEGSPKLTLRTKGLRESAAR